MYNYLALIFMGSIISHSSLAQRIVSQTSIELDANVQLFDPLTLYAFQDNLALGNPFPDFQTISIQDEVISLNQLLEQAVLDMRVPVIVFGRPSCNFMRAAYKEFVFSAYENVGSGIEVYHIANSIEAHATNNYVSPYFTVIQGDTVSGNVMIPDNEGFTFEQPFTGQELINLSRDFVSKMLETQAGTVQDFQNVTVLLDDVGGGFTQTFRGPAVMWVINPFDGTVVYERTQFGCYMDTLSGCQQELSAFLLAIQGIQDLYVSTRIEDKSLPFLPIELKGFNLFGQTLDESTLFYNPQSKEKIIKVSE